MENKFDPRPDFLGELEKQINENVKEKRYLDALLLQTTVLETTLRTAILHKIMITRREEFKKLERYAINSRARFSDLIKTSELLNVGDPTLIEGLENYSQKRNKIVHGILSFSTLEKLNKEAEFITVVGAILVRRLINLMVEEPCNCGSGKKMKDCNHE